MKDIDFLGFYNRNRLYKDMFQKTTQFLVLLDINEFYFVNYYYSEKIGNKVLKQIGKKIKAYFKIKKLYRSGDRFIILFQEINFTKKELHKLLNSFIHDIKLEPIKSSNGNIVLNITAGISSGPKFIEESEFAIKYARHHKLEVVFYEDPILEELVKNNLAKNIITEGNPLVHYQQIADQNKNIVKYEALLRIEHNGFIHYPDSFLRTSKNIKLYNLLTKKVVLQAFEDFKNRNEKVSINLSFEDIDNKEINDYIKNISKEYANIKKVDFEITESDAIKDYKKVQDFINAITNLGASFSIDDFGIGYSNFGMLRDLERIETIKIDGEFVRNYKTNNRYKILLENIVNLAKKMDIKIVAEYVENEEIFNSMKELGVDYFQGYYIGKPSPVKLI